MGNKYASRINGGNSEYGRVESDYYPTPPEATIALLEFLQLPKETVIWEPACGEGFMSEVFSGYGYDVISTDVNDTGYGESGIDFLNEEKRECDWIITNPPFRLAKEFIKRCDSHNIPFALLLKSQFWNAASRYELFKSTSPTAILPLTWRPDFLFKQRGSGSPVMDCMWCVWDSSKDNVTQFIPLKKPKV